MVFRKPAAVQAAKALSQEGPLLISTESHPVKTGISSMLALVIFLWANARGELYSLFADFYPACPILFLAGGCSVFCVLLLFTG